MNTVMNRAGDVLSEQEVASRIMEAIDESWYGNWRYDKEPNSLGSTETSQSLDLTATAGVGRSDSARFVHVDDNGAALALLDTQPVL